jgi:hypothetical protein
MKLCDIKPLNEMTYSDLMDMEKALFKLAATHMGIKYESRGHLKDRVVDDGREGDVEPEEILSTFRKLFGNPKKKGKILGLRQKGEEREFVVKDTSNDINITFKIDFSRKPNIFAIVTIMRKKNFKPKPYDIVYHV